MTFRVAREKGSAAPIRNAVAIANNQLNMAADQEAPDHSVIPASTGKTPATPSFNPYSTMRVAPSDDVIVGFPSPSRL
jgi:hypothetical protein